MAMAGVLTRHQGLRTLLAHGGGALPALHGRLRRAWTVQAPARARLAEPPDASLRRLAYDAVVHDPALLRALVAFAGPTQVLLGSDYPFDMGLPDPVGFVHSAGLDAEAERLMLGGNAARLLELEETAA